MKSFLSKITTLIPKARRKQLPFVFGISFLNSMLDFISIALLAPYLLLLFDKKKSFQFISDTFSISVNNNHIILSLLFLVLFYSLKNYIQTRIIFKQTKFIYGISSDISERLMKNYFLGNYLQQINQDKGALLRDFQQLPMLFGTFILLPLYHIVSELLIVIILIAIGFYFNPLMTVVSVSLILLGAFIILQLRNKKVRSLNNVIAQSYRESLNEIMNAFNGFLEIKSAKSEDEFTSKFVIANNKHNEQLSLLSIFKQSNMRFFEIFAIVVIATIILYVQTNSAVLINMVALSFLISAIIKFVPSFNKIINAVTDIKSNRHTVDILSSYKLYPEENETTNNISFQEKIVLKNISFHYQNKTPILKKMSMVISKGDFIAITGTSGIGKTTLLRLLTGLLLPNSGNISIDGKEITQIGFFNFAAMVSQQPFLFKGTLLENIVMKDNEKTDTPYIITLFKTFGLYDWFKSLEDGLETKINLDSKTISGGQKQRIALIRALYQKPKLLLLDEATNQLDEDLELQVLNYLKLLTDKNEITIVAVSHHASLLNFASQHIDMETMQRNE